MKVDFETDSVTMSRVWFDPRSREIHGEIAGMDHSIPLDKIPDEDFESQSPIVAFLVGCEGAVVVCKHRDGVETWLPSDMWLPGAFTTR